MLGPSGFGGNLGDGVGENGFGVLGVGEEHFEDGGGVDCFFVGLPAVVVGDHAQGGEGDFGFASELGFGDVGHPDEVESEMPVGIGFGSGREGGAVHVDVGAFLVNGDAGGGGAVDEDLAKVLAVGVGGGDVGYDAVAEEGVMFPSTCSVVVLVGDEDVAGGVVFFEAADGGDADDKAHAKGAQGPDIGAVIDLGGEQAMTTGVAGEKDDLAISEGALHEDIGGRAEGGINGEFLEVFQSFELIEAAAADDADHIL